MNNPFSLIGKTVLVTGASSGIGRTTAVECSKLGATLILTGRNEDRLKETLSLLEGDGHSFICSDITIEPEVIKLVEQLPVINGCVHNAGVIGLVPIQGITQNKIEEFEKINLHAPILLTRQLLKKKKIAQGASIVFTSSAAGVYRVSVGNTLYAITKNGIDAFMRSAALELAPKGIRCNSVNPAMIETNSISQIPIDQGQRQKNIAQYPLGRLGKPEEVAYAVIYLLSNASAWITGTSIKIDGGLTLS